jgi:predicted RNA-binding Zn ribbon-like protein
VVAAAQLIDDPGGRPPAPGRLSIVQAFVNTVDLEHGRELVASPADLRDLLVRLDLLRSDQRVGASELEQALELREALRRLLLANNGGTVNATSLAVLERVARAGRLTVRFGDSGLRPELVPQAEGVPAALAALVAIVFTAVAEGTWPRMKACRRDVCQWAFYDRSRNSSSTWCHMSVCGNRTKTTSYRRRRREGSY